MFHVSIMKQYTAILFVIKAELQYNKKGIKI